MASILKQEFVAKFRSEQGLLRPFQGLKIDFSFFERSSSKQNVSSVEATDDSIFLHRKHNGRTAQIAMCFFETSSRDR